MYDIIRIEAPFLKSVFNSHFTIETEDEKFTLYFNMILQHVYDISGWKLYKIKKSYPDLYTNNEIINYPINNNRIDFYNKKIDMSWTDIFQHNKNYWYTLYFKGVRNESAKFTKARDFYIYQLMCNISEWIVKYKNICFNRNISKDVFVHSYDNNTNKFIIRTYKFYLPTTNKMCLGGDIDEQIYSMNSKTKTNIPEYLLNEYCKYLKLLTLGGWDILGYHVYSSPSGNPAINFICCSVNDKFPLPKFERVMDNINKKMYNTLYKRFVDDYH